MEKYKIRYNIFKYLLGIIFYIYYRPKFVNKKVIPKQGPIIVCGNHIHLYDQCLPCLSTRRMLHYMAKKEYFDSKFAWFFKASGCIAVDRNNHGGDSKDKALEILNSSYALGIYPEGTRNSLYAKKEELKKVYEILKDSISYPKFSKLCKKEQVKLSQVNLLLKLQEDKVITKDELKKYLLNVNSSLLILKDNNKITSKEYNESLLMPLKYGTVSLASKTNATIIPYGIKGKYRFFNNKLTIVFGKPFKVQNLSLKDANQKLTEEIEKLIK